MSKLRKYTSLTLFVLFALTIGLSIYLNVKSENISNPKWLKYSQFVKTNGQTIGARIISERKMKKWHFNY